MLVFIFFITGCVARYTIHIQTIPPGDYGIYINNNLLGKTSSSRDTVVHSGNNFILSPAILELKDDISYGRLCMDYNAAATKMVNVYSVNSRTDGDLQNYNVTFLFDIRHAPHALNEKFFNPYNKDFSFIIKTPPAGSVYSCFSNLSVSDDNRLRHDADSCDFNLMTACIDTLVNRQNYSWLSVDSNIEHKITAGLVGKRPDAIDTLPNGVYDQAISRNIKYIVVFYGYSFLQQRRLFTDEVAAGVARTASVIFSIGFHVAPDGDKVVTLLDAYCSIFSSNPNKCIFTTKATLQDYYNNYSKEELTLALYDTVFSRIAPIFARSQKK
ncbi:MAG TPA: hypothetical protein VLX68_01895 [Chitinivibrionales bacterium]|nr:hypothetical protein [Chitinivibrionales bacterium]